MFIMAQNINSISTPVSASIMLILSILTAIIGLPVSLIAYGYRDQIDVTVFRTLIPLLPVVILGQLICVIYMRKGKLWGLISTTMFVVLLLAAQIIQSSTHPTKLLVYSPFVLPIILLMILWTKDRSYFS